MFDLIILVLFIALLLYIYVNEKIFQKGKMPFVCKLNEKDGLQKR